MSKILTVMTAFVVIFFLNISVVLAATGIVSFINNPQNLGKIVRVDDGSTDVYIFLIPKDVIGLTIPVEGNIVNFDVTRGRRATNVTLGGDGGGGA